jgi:hypothetical protein
MITFIASHLKQNSRQEEKQGETKNEKNEKTTTYTHKKKHVRIFQKATRQAHYSSHDAPMKQMHR